jgi:hypothetical protein
MKPFSDQSQEESERQIRKVCQTALRTEEGEKMSLIPYVASYIGLQNKVKETLTAQHMRLLLQVASAPLPENTPPAGVLRDLLEMHALTIERGEARLGTAVFLETDIVKVSAMASELGRSLASRVMKDGSDLLAAPAEVRNFLGCVIAAAQGPSHLLRDTGLMVDWRSYTGAYASTKVDFDEDCPALRELGPELQVKTTVVGSRYTAVLIGPEFPKLLNRLYPPDYREHSREILGQATDSYGDLLRCGIADEAVLGRAELAGLTADKKPRPILVTAEMYSRFGPAVEKVAAASLELYTSRLPVVFACLRDTTSGRQGVPPENMMMHFGRYCRKALARELYAADFLTDAIPAIGHIAVLYDNYISQLNNYLS